MSSTTTGTKAQRIRAKVALISALSLGAAILPVTLAGPAQAAPTQTSQRACTITHAGTPQKVYQIINFRVVEKVKYPVSVYCKSARLVNLHHTFQEADPGVDQQIGVDSPPIFWVGAGETKSFARYQPVVNTEYGNEEVYQKIRIQEGYAGLWTIWSGPRVSPTAEIKG